MKIISYYFTFSGRINVRKYWLTGVIPSLILLILGVFIDLNYFKYHEVPPVTVVILSLWFIPVLSILSRRCHDRNRSAVALWRLLIPFVGIKPAFELALVEGTSDKNNFDLNQEGPGVSPIFLMLSIGGLVLTLLIMRYGKNSYLADLFLVLLPLCIVFSSILAASFAEIYFCTVISLCVILLLGSSFDLRSLLSDADTVIVLPLSIVVILIGFWVNYVTRRLRNKIIKSENYKLKKKPSRIECFVGAVLLMTVFAFYIAIKPPTMGTVRRAKDPLRLMNIALEAEDEKVRTAATLKITDENLLARIARESKQLPVQQAALQKLTDQSLLAGVALFAYSENIQNNALERITDQFKLAEIALGGEPCPVWENSRFNTQYEWDSFQRRLKDWNDDPLWDRRLAAVSRLTDQELLSKVSKKANHQKIRDEALVKLRSMKD